MAITIQHTAPWADGYRRDIRYPRLNGEVNVDTVVIGGGITGVTTAYAFAREGMSVALLEKDQMGSGETYNTTALVSYAVDTNLTE